MGQTAGFATSSWIVRQAARVAKMINSAHWCQLEKLVQQLLERNLHLEESCSDLTAREQDWRVERDELLVEIESLLVELEQLREMAP